MLILLFPPAPVPTVLHIDLPVILTPIPGLRYNTMSTTSTYVGELPSLTIDPRIPQFFERFYAISDNPDTHEEYAHSLTDDATMIMGTRTVEGYKDILALRHSLWSGPIQRRKHTLVKIFPFGDNSNEVMLYGSVRYGLKNGKEVSVDWAGHALLVDDKGQLKMAFYQVYLVRLRDFPCVYCHGGRGHSLVCLSKVLTAHVHVGGPVRRQIDPCGGWHAG